MVLNPSFHFLVVMFDDFSYSNHASYVTETLGLRENRFRINSYYANSVLEIFDTKKPNILFIFSSEILH